MVQILDHWAAIEVADDLTATVVLCQIQTLRAECADGIVDRLTSRVNH